MPTVELSNSHLFIDEPRQGRPGYGGSAAQPGCSVADCAADVRAICAALGIERLAIWGISGGGPHVLACAALLPDLALQWPRWRHWLRVGDVHAWLGSRR
jgi:pimeloyl-ACP methyl ester carboxylesterase